MTRDLIVGGPDDEVESVMQAMTQNRIRHLPIVEEAELVGIISIGDVVKAQLDASSVENRFLRNYLAT
jgi:CBS domain-containing protein